MRLRILIAIVGIFAPAGMHAGPLSAVDDRPEIVGLFGGDSLLKAVIVSGNGTEGDLVGIEVLDRALLESLKQEGASARIAAELSEGDDRLRAALVRLLVGLNINGGDAASMVARWALAGSDRALEAALSSLPDRADLRAVLREYFVDNDIVWIKSIGAMNRMLKTQGERQALGTAIVAASGIEEGRLKAVMDRASEGDADSLWALSGLVNQVAQSGGAVGRAIKATPADPNAWYVEVWKRALEQVEADPAAVAQFQEKAPSAGKLRSALDQHAVRSLRNNGEALAEGFILAGADQRSRFGRALEVLLPRDDHPEFFGPKGGPMNEKGRAQATKKLNEAMVLAPWRDWLLWHGTRPAEATAQTVRQGLVATMGGDLELARKMIARGQLWGPSFEKGLLERGGYGNMGPQALRAAVDSEKAEKGAMETYMQAAMQTLAEDDGAWHEAVLRSEGQPGSLFAALVAADSQRDPRAAAAWAMTMAGNDAMLAQGFVTWLLNRGVFGDERAAWDWLVAVSGAAAAGASIGNVDIARFKSAFAEYALTQEGWPLVWRRLMIEGPMIPGELRRIMIQDAMTYRDDFWKLYGYICAARGPAVDGLRRKAADYLARSGLVRIVLQEVAAPNPRAADAVSPIWSRLLKPGTALDAGMAREMTSGVTSSSAYVMGLAALRTMARRDWSSVAHLAIEHMAAPDLPTYEKTLLLEGRDNRIFIEAVLADQKARAAWLKELEIAALYYSKSDILARFVRQDEDRMREWASALRDLMAEDPFLARGILDSCVANVGGGGVGAAEEIRKGLVTIVFGDRVFFEWMVDDPAAPMRGALEAASGQPWRKTEVAY